METTFKIIAVLAAIDFIAVACLLAYRAVNSLKQRAIIKKAVLQDQASILRNNRLDVDILQNKVHNLEHRIAALVVQIQEQSKRKTSKRK